MKNYYYQSIRRCNKLLLVLIAAAVYTGPICSQAQTTLVAGDIAFTGYNSNNGTDGLANEFSFLILKSGGVASNTVIEFTDNGWDNSTTALSAAEGTIHWTTTTNLPQFTEVKIKLNTAGTIISTVSAGSATLSTNGFILSQGGDQVLAYQGSVSSPTFIAGIHMNSEIMSGSNQASTAATWDIISTPGWPMSGLRSAIPPGLTNGANAIMVVETPGVSGAEKDNAAFNCSAATATTLAILRSNLCNVNNWSLMDLTPYTLPTNCGFGVGNPPSITSQPINDSTCVGNNAVFSITATNATGYQWQVDQGSGFTNITNVAPYSGATTATLTVTAATIGLNGYSYRCVVSGTITPTAVSNSVKIIVNTSPVITAHPANSSICEESSTTFVITANNVTSYQWQVNTGAGFINLTNQVPYTGTTTATLVITDSTFGFFNGYIYRCYVSGPCSPGIYSNSATLTIKLPPSISLQPRDSAICEGGNATFSIIAGNSTSYQWQADPGTGFVNLTDLPPFSGVTTATLKLSAATNSVNNYKFRCLASGICTPPATSAPATIKIYTSPEQPATINGKVKTCNGEREVYTIDPVKDASSYTWTLLNGSTVTTTTTSTNMYVYVPGGVIKVIANNSCGSSTAKELNIIVNALPIVTLGTFPEICLTASPLALTGGSPAGGTYKGNGVASNTFNPNTAGIGATIISYFYKDANNCVDTASSSINVTDCNSGIATNKASNGFSVYPNPFHDKLSIKISNLTENTYLELYTMLGQKIIRERITSVVSDISTSQLQKGIYFLHLITPQQTVTKKIIKY